MKNYGLAIGGAGFADILNNNGMIRTVEQTLVDFISDEPAGLLLTDRRHNAQVSNISTNNIVSVHVLKKFIVDYLTGG